MTIKAKLREVESRDTSVLQFSGDLDFDDRDAFRAQLDKTLELQHSQIVLDLGEVRRMASVYIGAIMVLGASAAEKGQRVTVIAPHTISRLCRTAGIDKVVTVVDAE